MTWLSLTLAILLMSVAHFIRVLRWELFVKVYEKPDRKRLLNALSIGYLLNYFVPYKLGDLVRGFYSGQNMKNGKALGLSTVIVDRYLDILSVGIIFSVLAIINKSDATLVAASKFYIIFLIALVVFTALVFAFRGYLKKLVRLVAGLFNQRIETAILRFAWALIWNFKDIFQKINKLRLILSTLAMWVVYLLSYEAFSVCYTSVGKQSGWVDIFIMLFGSSGVKASTMMVGAFGSKDKSQFYLVIFMLAPLLVLFMISSFVKKLNVSTDNKDGYFSLLPQINTDERLAFLDIYFNDRNKEYIDNYLKINHGISVIRDYSAGSNATTMLCVDDRGTFFRKYAFGAAGAKLSEQINWINENSSLIPLPKILESDSNEMYCYYDMPYMSNAVGMFEFVHSQPVDEGWSVLKNVLDTLEGSIYVTEGQSPCHTKCDRGTVPTVTFYIEKKVQENLKKLKEAKKLKSLLEYDTIVINGKEYKNLCFYEKMLSSENLEKVFSDDKYSVIHGDLTIENIVCVRDGAKNDFYLIDPNTGNIHNSPNLDYAKILQSLHGGYEFLMSVKNVTVEKNHIDFLYAKSYVYEDLYKRLDAYMADNFSKERIKSIYYHEIVHWLRLMPYKIEKDYHTAPAFYAGMLMVLNDIYERFS